MADVAQNQDKGMEQNIVNYNEVSLQSAKDKMDATQDEDERLFYQMIFDHLRGTRHRYLRTLNVFSRKGGRGIFKRRPKRKENIS